MAGRAFSRLSHPAGTTRLCVHVPEWLLCLAGLQPVPLTPRPPIKDYGEAEGGNSCCPGGACGNSGPLVISGKEHTWTSWGLRQLGNLCHPSCLLFFHPSIHPTLLKTDCVFSTWERTVSAVFPQSFLVCGGDAKLVMHPFI